MTRPQGAYNVTIRNPDYRDEVARIFASAGFVQHLGITLLDLGPGWCETEIVVRPFHLQQSGVIHAGVQATLADHTAGGAATTLIASNQYLLSVEFKVNFLRAVQTERLRCRAEVLKPGRTLTIAESEVYAEAGDVETLISKATVTMAVVQA